MKVIVQHVGERKRLASPVCPCCLTLHRQVDKDVSVGLSETIMPISQASLVRGSGALKGAFAVAQRLPLSRCPGGDPPVASPEPRP